MQLGIFARTFARPTLEGVLDAVVAHGLARVQFNLACAGVGPSSTEIDPAVFDAIGAAHQARGLTMAAVSATYNMIHPDPAVQAAGLARLEVLARNAHRMGTSVLTLCTGTLDPDDMWKSHPDNGSKSAWKALVAAIKRAIEVAEVNGVTLGIEPETSNVVGSAEKARELLDEFRSPRLKVVLDPANLLTHKTAGGRKMRAVLEDAFDLLGLHLVLAHAKEYPRPGHVGHEVVGRGVLDFGHYLELLRDHEYQGPLILHGVDEGGVGESLSFLRGEMARVEAGGDG